MKSYARRFAIALLALAALFVFASCGGGATEAEAEGTNRDEAFSGVQVDDVMEAEDNVEQESLEIEVVSRTRHTDWGSFSEIVTEYSYDPNGYLISTSQWSEGIKESSNLVKREFEYDDSGNLVIVTFYAFSHDAEWNPLGYYRYSYDEHDRCIAFSISDMARCEYEYDDSGRISSILETNDGEPNRCEPVSSSEVFLKYSDDGRIYSIVPTGDTLEGLGYAEELSDPEHGLYAYSNGGDQVTRLYFDDQGLLVRCRNSLDTTYEYKTISVDPATYKPSIYCIPTGFEEKWKPQYSEEECSLILKGR